MSISDRAKYNQVLAAFTNTSSAITLTSPLSPQELYPVVSKLQTSTLSEHQKLADFHSDAVLFLE
jgi:hypothetical protein